MMYLYFVRVGCSIHALRAKDSHFKFRHGLWRSSENLAIAPVILVLWCVCVVSLSTMHCFESTVAYDGCGRVC